MKVIQLQTAGVRDSAHRSEYHCDRSDFGNITQAIGHVKVGENMLNSTCKVEPAVQRRRRDLTGWMADIVQMESESRFVTQVRDWSRHVAGPRGLYPHG